MMRPTKPLLAALLAILLLAAPLALAAGGGQGKGKDRATSSEDDFQALDDDANDTADDEADDAEDAADDEADAAEDAADDEADAADDAADEAEDEADEAADQAKDAAKHAKDDDDSDENETEDDDGSDASGHGRRHGHLDREAREQLRANRTLARESFVAAIHGLRASWHENATAIREACLARAADDNSTDEDDGNETEDEDNSTSSRAHCLRDGYKGWREQARASISELREQLRALLSWGRARHADDA